MYNIKTDFNQRFYFFTFTNYFTNTIFRFCYDKSTSWQEQNSISKFQIFNFELSILELPFAISFIFFFFFFFFSQFFPEQLEFHIGETNMDILVSMAAEEYALFWMFEMKELRNIHNNWNSKHIACATVLTICPILQRGKIAEEEFLEWDSIDCEIIRGIDTRWEIVRFQIGFRRKERERERERERQVFYVRGWSRYLRWSKRHKDGLICKWLHRCVVQE